MEQLTGNQINYIIQKLMELNDGLTLSDLNELSLYIGIEEIDPIEYSTSNNSNHVLANQFKKILNEIGQKVQDLDTNKLYYIYLYNSRVKYPKSNRHRCNINGLFVKKVGSYLNYY